MNKKQLDLSFDKDDIRYGIAEFLLIKEINLDEYKRYPILSYIRKAFHEFYQDETEYNQLVQEAQELAQRIRKDNIHPTTNIHPTAFVDKYVIIGENVIIHAGALVGVQGMLGKRNHKNEIVRETSDGNVIIEDNVDIGAGTVIQRGHNADTIIGRGTKVDVSVHIAHDCVIGKDCFIIASATIAGVTKIGDSSYIGLGAIIRDGIVIGKNVTVGMGAVVTRNVSDGWTVVGNPAMRIEKFREQRKKLESISLLKRRKLLKGKFRGFARRVKRSFRS